MKKVVMLIVISWALARPEFIAAEGNAIVGVWDNEEKDAKIEVYHCGEKYCGRIISLKEPNYPEGSRDGVPGTPKLDHHNPDANLRIAPIIGLIIMHDFAFSGSDEWVGGTVYDPKNGKTYSGKLTLVSPSQLKLRGFIGISLFGRTSVWTKQAVH